MTERYVFLIAYPAARYRIPCGDLGHLLRPVGPVCIRSGSCNRRRLALISGQIHERGRLDLRRFADIRYAADIAVGMLSRTLDAFARLDAAVAADVSRKDVEIDIEFRSNLRRLITFMKEHPRTISTALEVVWVAKAIECIGDHARNIAEYVVYIASGREAEQTPFERLEREASRRSGPK